MRLVCCLPFSRNPVRSHFSCLFLPATRYTSRPAPTLSALYGTMTQFKLAKSPEEMKYPLLDWDKFPNFAEIKSSPVVPAFDLLVKRVETEFEKREEEFRPSWEGTMGLGKI